LRGRWKAEIGRREDVVLEVVDGREVCELNVALPVPVTRQQGGPDVDRFGGGACMQSTALKRNLLEKTGE